MFPKIRAFSRIFLVFSSYFPIFPPPFPASPVSPRKCPGLSLQHLDDALDVSDATERLASASAARVFHLVLPAALALLMLALLALRVARGRGNWAVMGGGVPLKEGQPMVGTHKDLCIYIYIYICLCVYMYVNLIDMEYVG